MSKIKLTGSNSGYVEIDSAADAGNLTLTLPTSGVRLLSNTDNVFSGITTTGELDINGKIDVSTDAVIARNLSVGGITTHTGTTTLSDDVTFIGGSYNILWDKSDNALEFADNAVIKIGSSGDLELFHDGNNSYIKEVGTGALYIRGSEIQLQSVSGEQMIGAFTDGGVTLRSDNVVRLTTTNTGVVVAGICTATSFSGSGEGLTYTSQLSHRNIVINGAMTVTQRATSASMSAAGNDIPVCDRWQYNRNGVTATIAQVAETPAGQGFKYSLKWTSTSAVGSIAAGNVVKFSYAIETQDIQRLGYGSANGKTVTLSFWAKGSLSGKIGVSCTRDSRIYSTNEDIVANTWKFVEITIPADTSTGFSGNDTASGFYFGITWGAGSSSTSGATNSWINFHNAYSAGFTAGQQGAYLTTNGSTFQITGVQLEVGSVATPFEHRSIGDELIRCKRYYQKFAAFSDHYHFGVARAESNTARTGLVIPVPMRAAPTVACNGSRTFRGDGGYNSESTSTPSVYNTGTWISESNMYTVDFPGHSLNHNQMYCLMSKTTSANGLSLDAEL